MRILLAGVAVVLALTLTACGDDQPDPAVAAHTSACRSFALLSGDGGPAAVAAVSHAAESGGYSGDRLLGLLAPVIDASLRAASTDRLSDQDFTTFRALHTAALTVRGRVVRGGILDNSLVVALQKALRDEAATCA